MTTAAMSILLFLALGIAIVPPPSPEPPAPAGESLTLERALALARERNGDIRAATASFLVARSRVRQRTGAFLPVISPVYDFRSTRSTGGGFEDRSLVGDQFEVGGSWRLLDNGSRLLDVRAAESAARASERNALQTLRRVLFGVHEQFYEAVRAEELLKVQEAQLERTRQILRQTEVQVEVGAAARKDILQARADFLNAQAAVLAARNRVTAALANLKATIGWHRDRPLPPLARPPTPLPEAWPQTLAEAVEEGLKARPDLEAQRARLESARVAAQTARLDAALVLSLDVTYRRRFDPTRFESSALVLQASLPLFDGGISRERIRQSDFEVDAALAQLEQARRVAQSEIETAFVTFEQNRARLEATSLALEAARLNFEAARRAREEGAGNLIEVLTAQVSLVTAESNNVEASFDALVSEVRLRLALGRELPGERS